MLAVDIGANSGRILVGQYDGTKITYEEYLRFTHLASEVQGELFWDFERIWKNVKEGIHKAMEEYDRIDSIGIDSFCPDFVCFDQEGKLQGRMKSYRNFLDGKMLQEVFTYVSEEEFRESGNAPLAIALLPQLLELQKRSDACREGKIRILPLPNALNYLLGGRACTDFTQISVSMLFNKEEKDWDKELCNRFLEHPEILPPVRPCGTIIGNYQGEEENGRKGTALIHIGSHDTATANLMLSMVKEKAIYIHTGTWTSVGVKVQEPILGPLTKEYEISNYGLPDETYILCKTTMGMWFLQECKRCWEKDGTELSYPEISKLAESGRSLEQPIDLLEARYLNAYGTLHRELASELAARAGWEQVSVGDIARSIYDYIADSYEKLIGNLEEITGETYSAIVLGGGAVRDSFFCKYVEEKCKKQVIVSSPEATGLGNMIMQLKALEGDRLTEERCRRILEYSC